MWPRNGAKIPKIVVSARSRRLHAKSGRMRRSLMGRGLHPSRWCRCRPWLNILPLCTKMVHVIEARTVTPNLGGRRGWTGAPAIELPQHACHQSPDPPGPPEHVYGAPNNQLLGVSKMGLRAVRPLFRWVPKRKRGRAAPTHTSTHTWMVAGGPRLMDQGLWPLGGLVPLATEQRRHCLATSVGPR